MSEDTTEDQMTQEEYYRGMVETMIEQDGWLNDLLIPRAHTHTTNGSSTQDFSLENLLSVKGQLKPLAETHRKNEELIAELGLVVPSIELARPAVHVQVDDGLGRRLVVREARQRRVGRGHRGLRLLRGQHREGDPTEADAIAEELPAGQLGQMIVDRVHGGLGGYRTDAPAIRGSDFEPQAAKQVSILRAVGYETLAGHALRDAAYRLAKSVTVHRVNA